MDYVEVCVYICYVFWINLMIIIFLVGLGKGFLLFSCSIWVIVICGEFYSILIGGIDKWFIFYRVFDFEIFCRKYKCLLWISCYWYENLE